MASRISQTPSLRQPEMSMYLSPGHLDDDAPEVTTFDPTLRLPKPEPSPARPSTSRGITPEDRPGTKRTTICGLVPAVFMLLVILVVVIIIAAVGGGVGGSLAVKNARSYVIQRLQVYMCSLLKFASREGIAEGQAACSTATDTRPDPTATDSQTAPAATETSGSFAPPTDVNLALNCPSLTGDRTTIELPNGSIAAFISECGVDRDVQRITIVAAITYSFEHCLRACAVYNLGVREDKCVAVTWLADLPTIIDTYNGNCFLKASRGDRILYEDPLRNLRVSALLVEGE